LGEYSFIEVGAFAILVVGFLVLCYIVITHRTEFKLSVFGIGHHLISEILTFLFAPFILLILLIGILFRPKGKRE